ncbi:MAG: transporter [candidate division NC10 bacterium]|nr:transporter [candidate division NC10 bacterium]
MKNVARRLLEPMAHFKQNPSWMIASSGLLPLFMLAHFAHHMVNSLAVPLLPMIRQDFGLDYTRSGLLVAALTVPYGLSQFPAGWLADRVGAPLLLTIGISGVAIAGLLAGLSPDYNLLFVCFVAMGVAGGGYHPAAPPLISAAVEPKNLGRAMGLHMVTGSAPFFLAPLIAVALAAAWGWRGTFIVLAIPTILFGVILHRILGRRLSAKAPGYAAGGSTTQAEAAPHGTIQRIAPFVRHCSSNRTVCHSQHLRPRGDLLRDRLHSPVPGRSVRPEQGSSRGLHCDFLFRRAVGKPPGRGAVRPLRERARCCLLFVLGVCNYVRTPVSETYLVSQTTERNRSTVLGIYYFSTYEGGGVLTPLMGLLMDHHGFNVSFALAGTTVLLVFFACWIWLRPSLRH